MGKKFVASYSGGKDSALAIHKAIDEGHELIALITTYDEDAGRSWSHGMPKEILERVGEALGVPAWSIETTMSAYAQDFTAALKRAKEFGAQGCVFGDTDIEGHLHWGEERCQEAGIEAIFPLWGKDRKDVVYDMINQGFIATINVIDTKQLSDRFLGKILTKEVVDEIAATGADICGENGEYHTFASDGPIFKHPVDFSLGDQMMRDDYAILPFKVDH